MKNILFLIMALMLNIFSFAQWTEQNSGATTGLTDIYFLDQDTGYCVGMNGTILKTVNGGIIWSNISILNNSNFQEVYFKDTKTGWLCGDGGAYQTNDGGISFIPLDSFFGNTDTTKHLNYSKIIGTFGNTTIIKASFTDFPQTSPADFYCIATSDGGSSWHPFNYPGGYIQFVSPSVLFAAGFPLRKSSDGGNTWTDIPNTATDFPPLNRKCFKIYDTLGNGWAALTYELHFVNIRNNGDSVLLSYNNNGNFLNAITQNHTSYFLRSTGQSIEIYTSEDSGNTFNLLTSDTLQGVYSLYFFSDSLGYVCSENGRIYKFNSHSTSIRSSLRQLFSIFPNPAKNNIQLKYSGLHIQSLQLTDLSGRIIKTFAPESKRLEVSGLASGVYFLQVKAKEGEMTEKVVITSL